MIKFSLRFRFVHHYLLNSKLSAGNPLSRESMVAAINHFCVAHNCISLQHNTFDAQCSEEDFVVIQLKYPDAVSYFEKDDK